YQGGAEGLIRLVSGGGDGIFVATQYNFVDHYVLMTDPSISRLEDLRGKRIALDPTSPTYGYMLKVLERVGLKKEDVSFVQFGTAATRTDYGGVEGTGGGHGSDGAEYLCRRKTGTEKILHHSLSGSSPAYYGHANKKKICP